MKNAVKKRAALLAASSVLAASASFGAMASDHGPAAPAPATFVEALLAPAEAAAPSGSEEPSAPAGKWALAVLAAGALAWLIKLVGVRKAVARAAHAAATATGAAVKAAGRVVVAPLRWAAGLFGLGLFILTGVGLYDIEWIAGLAVGAGLALAGAAGLGGLRRKWLPGVMGNRN